MLMQIWILGIWCSNQLLSPSNPWWILWLVRHLSGPQEVRWIWCKHAPDECSTDHKNPTLHDGQMRSIWFILILMNVAYLCMGSLENESWSFPLIWKHMNTYSMCWSIDARGTSKYMNRRIEKDLCASNWNSFWCNSIICFDAEW
jgi:hypothetical protein